MPTEAHVVMNHVLAGVRALVAVQEGTQGGKDEARRILTELSSVLQPEHVDYLLERIEIEYC